MFPAMLQSVVVGFGDLPCCRITFTDCSSGCWVFTFAAMLQTNCGCWVFTPAAVLPTVVVSGGCLPMLQVGVRCLPILQ